MAGTLRNIIEDFSHCYSITGSLRESIRFAFPGNSNRKFPLKLSDGKKVFLRRNKTDKDVFITTFFSKYHRLPFYPGCKPVIIDIGCNIGLTIVDFLTKYPDAQLIGVEMDASNFSLACENTKEFPGVVLIQKAVWPVSGMVKYNGPDAQSLSVVNNSGIGTCAEAITMPEIFEMIPGGKADYLKIDIEGGEYPLLLENSSLEWLKNIRYISIEVHNAGKYNSETGVALIIKKLTEQNFLAYKSGTHWSAVFAVNKAWAL